MEVIQNEIVDTATNDSTDYQVITKPTEKPRKEKMKSPELELDSIERQRRYVESQQSNDHGIGVVFQSAFINGMRDIGYKNPAWAIAELIDNSIQAAAQNVEIKFGYKPSNKGQSKPDHLAIIDDGSGMIPEMISWAVRWGGTDRENNRNGFGRFGFGLPSAAVSIACRYTVYSKVKGGEWHAVTVDLSKLANLGTDVEKADNALQSKPATLPIWLSDKNGIDIQSMDSGSIVVLEDIDRLRTQTGWITSKALKQKLFEYLGIIYRHWTSDVNIIIDGGKCEPIDPLFLIPNGRHFAETKILAKSIKTRAFEVKTPSGETGIVRIRASLLPPQFCWTDPENLVKGRADNKRWRIIRQQEYNGLCLCREGRHIDTVSPNWTRFQNNDRYIKIEIDFDPELDEFFGVTTSKQQITIHDDMLEKLKSSGKEAGNLVALIRDMRQEWSEQNSQLYAKVENALSDIELPLPSGTAMKEAEKFKTKTPHLSAEQQEEARRNYEQKVEEEIKNKGKTREQAEKDVKASIEKRPWDIEFKAIEEGPFYIPKRLGTQKVITINTNHPFYKKIYNESTMDKSVWEVLLFVLADGEIDANGDRNTFYKSERLHWSELLRHALDRLVDDSTIVDKTASKIEADEEINGNSA